MPTETEQLKNVRPYDLDAEQAVLGAILLDPANTIAHASLRPGDFYKTVNRVIFGAMQQMHGRGEQIDLVTAAAELRKPEYEKKLPEGFSVASHLSLLISETPTAANFKAHERLVLNAAILNAVINTCLDTQAKAYDKRDPDAVIAECVTKLNDIRMQRGDVEVMPYSVLMRLGFETIEKHNEAALAGKLTGITTGFRDIDLLNNGWQAGDLIIVAGRTGRGKTAFAMKAVHAAAVSGRKVGVVSIEMQPEQLALRDISRESQVPLSRLNSGHLFSEDWERLAKTVGDLSGLPIWGVFSAYTAHAVERAINHLVQAFGCEMVIVDYLQLLSIEDHKGTREQEVSAISRMLKRKAKELRVPVLALAQLNRAIEHRQDKRPTLADLRESGSLEQDADVVAFIHQDECRCPMDVDCFCGNRKKAWYLQRKGRMNGTGDVPLTWDGKTTRFGDAEE